jgi:bifunctional enzyme CysN/CysC
MPRDEDGPSAGDFAAGVASQNVSDRPLLRVLICGSVDDGKSTLIGRLIHDTGNVADDELTALDAASRMFGSRNGERDYALLVDGLIAEREQGITIDVAYRYFATEKRTFIIADAPGHEQYTRNMASGASVSDVAVLVVDAAKGLVAQSRRHCHIIRLLGIRDIIFVVNKMDRVDCDEAVFLGIEKDVLGFAATFDGLRAACIPAIATLGENVVRRSERMPWYEGRTLLDCLEQVLPHAASAEAPLRMPVQLVSRHNGEFRGYAGTLACGSVRVGDEIVVMPSGQSTRVARIVTFDGDVPGAYAGQAVTLVLADDVDVGRGMIIAAPTGRPIVADQVAAHLIWLGDEHMLPGRSYIIQCGSQTATASVTALEHKLSVHNFERVAARELEINDIASCNLSFSKFLAFDPYDEVGALGSFILIDKVRNETVAAGMIKFALRRAENVYWQALAIDKTARARALGQKPRCLWFTGLSGSGKSTIANLLEKRLHILGQHTYVLDGDNVRHGLNRDLGFTDADRVENIRRVGEVAKLMVDAGLITIVAFISPFENERQMARDLFAGGEFLEIYVDTPLDVCEQRDPKGLYRKARAGHLKHFTGLDSPYEVPKNPAVRLSTTTYSPDELVDQILRVVL